ncbi:MAG: hypothetical protein M3R36_00340 [Bacteroidota bacterium]|nr:hypothetical protein [Bacteroidota bacterium]
MKEFRKNITVILLFLSYFIVLGHSIFPHEHHDEMEILNTKQYHSSEIHHPSNDLNFHNYYHSGNKEFFVKRNSLQYNLIPTNKYQADHFINRLLLLDINLPPPLSLTAVNFIPDFNNILYSFSALRAPPLS